MITTPCVRQQSPSPVLPSAARTCCGIENSPAHNAPASRGQLIACMSIVTPKLPRPNSLTCVQRQPHLHAASAYLIFICKMHLNKFHRACRLTEACLEVWAFHCAGYLAAWAHRLIPLVVEVHMPSGPFFHAAFPVPSQRNHGAPIRWANQNSTAAERYCQRLLRAVEILPS